VSDNEDDENKPPPLLRIVSENPNAHTDRQVAWAKAEVQRALSEFAAALLRTMAGNDTEAIYLIRRLAHFVETLNKFREEFGQGLSVAELQEVLRLPQAELDAGADDWRYRRYIREDALDTIVKGALRLAAHKVLGEEPAFGGMHSERVIEQGIRALEELKRRPLPPITPQPQQKDLAHGWDDIDLGPPKPEESKPVSGQRLKHAASKVGARRREPDRSFSQQDLKELRKAIKANDKKRIAELTAKIGKPSDN
jgi:hypothetical protein